MRRVKTPKPKSTYRGPKLRKAPKLTAEEKEGCNILTRVWDRLQQQGFAHDKLKTARAKKKQWTGEIRDGRYK